MKKVLLISTNTEKVPYPVPPIGLCIVSQSISVKYEVKVHDCMADDGKLLPDVVSSFKPDYIGCSIRNVDNMSVEAPEFFLDTIKEKIITPVINITDIPVILGGSAFSMYPYEMLDFFGLDYGICGEGEESFLQLLEGLDNKEDVSRIKGVISRESESFKSRKKNTSAYPIKKYYSGIEKFIDFGYYRERGAYSIQTKRGCCHQCIYCTYPLIEGKHFRIRRPDEIAEEIKHVSESLGDVYFEFVDSTFNDPAGHAESICREIINRNLKVRLRTMGINPANTSGELFALMKQAGFVQIDVTPDSASPLMLKNLRKNFSQVQLQKTAELLRQSGLPVMWFFVFGGPGETCKTIDETFDFIEKYVSKEDLVHISTSLRIYPGTRLCSIAMEEKLISPEDSLLRPVFYTSDKFPLEELYNYLKEKQGRKHNVLFSSETKPPPDML
ncbi:MAG: radical SAM protein, partial [Bacteroidales bacterium]